MMLNNEPKSKESCGLIQGTKPQLPAECEETTKFLNQYLSLQFFFFAL